MHARHAVLTALLALASGCMTSPTEVLVVVSTNVSPSTSMHVDVKAAQVGSTNAPDEFFFDRTPSANFPVSFAVVPAHGVALDAQVELRVTTSLGTGATLVQIDRFHFTAGQRSDLRADRSSMRNRLHGERLLRVHRSDLRRRRHVPRARSDAAAVRHGRRSSRRHGAHRRRAGRQRCARGRSAAA
jgi:hypothetical protein